MLVHFVAYASKVMPEGRWSQGDVGTEFSIQHKINSCPNDKYKLQYMENAAQLMILMNFDAVLTLDHVKKDIAVQITIDCLRHCSRDYSTGVFLFSLAISSLLKLEWQTFRGCKRPGQLGAFGFVFFFL